MAPRLTLQRSPDWEVRGGQVAQWMLGRLARAPGHLTTWPHSRLDTWSSGLKVGRQDWQLTGLVLVLALVLVLVQGWISFIDFLPVTQRLFWVFEP